MDGVIIRPVEPADRNDTRGMTYEWCRGLPGMQVTFGERKAGTVSGKHWHKGEDPSKNPERFLLVYGRMRARFCDGLDTEEKLIQEPFMELLIPPNILHAYIAVDDILFAEYRPTVYDRGRPDTYFAKDFIDYKRSKDSRFDEATIRMFLRSL